MTATKREQQPFVYGSLSKEEIYLRAPAVPTPARVAADPVVVAPTEDEKFWQAIQTSTVVGLYEEFLSRYPRSSHVAEARQRIKDFRSKEVAAASPATISSRLEDNSKRIKGGEDSSARPSDRNLFTAEHSQKVAAIGAAQRLDIPKFTISPAQDESLGANSRFVGIWSNKLGWANGKGRYGMLIITEVSATGLARGYYLWGPPKKQSWVQDAAGYKWFAEYIVNDKFSIKVNPEVTAKLDSKNVLTLSAAKSDKPSEKSSIELRPIWQLARVRENVEPSAKREQPSRNQAPKREAPAESSPPRNASGSTMEDRYRACRKLVKGFAQREACARNGSI